MSEAPAPQQALLQKLFSSSWWVTALALGEIVLGFILLGAPYLLGASAVWLAGLFLGMGGIVHLIQVFRSPHGRAWNALTGLLFIILALVMIRMPTAALSIITLALGLILILAGVVRFIIALGMRGVKGSTWRFFNAIISIILGSMVSLGWPESTEWFIGTLIAVEMIFAGWTLLYLAITPSMTQDIPQSSK